MRTSTFALALAASSLIACTVGDGTTGDDDVLPTSGEISGAITADQAWSGTVTLVADATIEAGVTVTVAAGTVFQARMGTTLRVAGTLLVDGTAAAPVTMNPTADAMTWAGVVVDSGGAATLTYAQGANVATLLYCHAGATACVLDHVTFTDMNKALQAEADALIDHGVLTRVGNGGVTIMAGDVVIRDTKILTSSGDVIVQNGGAMTLEYAEVGEAMGSYEHCDLHINSATALRIVHSNIRAAVYGMMIGGTDGAVIQFNNFVENDPAKDISEVGTNTAVDLRFNYWGNGAPVGLGGAYDVSSPAAAVIADAGPRP
ncbi:MAG: hypothetical protein IPL61_02705 [Myxococcales bacterium]|nr:hypothetical protein [Myxococcales bacterium]